MIRVYIADDHQVLIDGLKMLIDREADMTLVGTASSGEEVLENDALQNVDVLLLDINLPGISGIDTCQALKKKMPSLAVIGLSTYDKGSIIRKMMKSGASGFVLKNAGSDELIKAIRTVAKGDIFLGDLANKALMDELTGQSADRADFIPELTRREKQVLRLIAQEFTTAEIGEKLFIGVNTVETYRKNLLQKLQAKNTAGLVRIAMERGLLE